MARLEKIIIEGYRSIQHPVEIKFPSNMPVVLIGENNAGKSNIVRATDILFGQYYPKYKDFEDHDYYGRDPTNELEIKARVSGFEGRLGRNGEYSCLGFKLNATKGREHEFIGLQDNGQENPYVSNDLRQELSSIIVNAEQNLSYQLSYASKFTLLSKVTKSFHNRLTSDEQRVEKLKELYEEIKSTFLEVPEFADFNENMSSIAGQTITNMSYGLGLDFSAYDPSNYFKTLSVQPSHDGEIRTIDELGTGQQQILALSFAHAYSKSFLGDNLLLMIDEPESHLHPLAQKWLARTMFEMANDGLQVVLTTHSPHFINIEFLEGINLIRKDAEGTYSKASNAAQLVEHCVRTGVNQGRVSEESVIPFYDNHSTAHILNGLFANKVILVEGQTEELALPVYLKKVGLDSLQEGIEVIGVSGKGNLAKWWRFFTLYNIPTFICFDNDRTNDGDGNRRKDALKAIGIPEEELDGVLGNGDWNINDRFCVFGVDFETTMKASFEDYDQLEREVKEELGNSKHIVARTVAQRLEVNEDDVGWERMRELAENIKELTS